MRSTTKARTSRRRLALIAGAIAVTVAAPAIAATCFEEVSGGIGGSGFLGGPRTVMNLGKGTEIGVIVCKEGKIRQVFNATEAVMFICE